MGNTKKMMAISMKIPQSLVYKLDVISRRRGISRSELARDAIAKYVVEAEVAKGSVLERASHLAGIVKGGPPDLSTNKKHMEGFGKT